METNTSTSTNPSSAIPNDIPPTQSKSSFKDIIIIILIVLVLGLGGMLYMQKQRKISSVQQSNISPISETVTQSPSIVPSSSVSKVCENKTLSIKLMFEPQLWTCKTMISEGINELTLSQKNIVLKFSNGNRGEACLGCKKQEKVISTPFAQLSKLSENTEGNTIIYFGNVLYDKTIWITASRVDGNENIYGNDFSSVELESIHQLLTPQTPQ